MFNFPEKKWCYREANESLCESLANELHLPKPIVSLLLQRGLKSSEEIDNFLNPTLAQLPSPSLMKGMNQAVNLLYETLVSRSPVIIYGDYDVDGATGTALLALFFKLVGFKVIYYQPNRLADGYGLHKTSIEKLFEQVRGYSHPLLVTVDCGISALDEVAYAKDLGLKVVITDHHKPPVELPVADAILNPLQPKCKFPFQSLAGVGVAFYLAMGLRSLLAEKGHWRQDNMPNLKQLLDLVAIGTIADMVPLTGVNRILVKAGLEVLAHTDKKGLLSLFEQAGIDRRLITAEDVAFQIGPRINAAGRLGDPERALELLITDNHARAHQLAAVIEAENNRRKEIGNELFDTVKVMAAKLLEREKKTLVLAGEGWHRGVIGIVASRIMQEFHRPTIVLSFEDGLAKGSGRSIPGVDLYNILQHCEDLLEGYGGHFSAVGLTLQEQHLEAFTRRFEDLVAQHLPEDDLVPTLWIDQKIGKEFTLDINFLKYFNKLQPFGKGNPEPVFSSTSLLQSPRIVGEIHLQFLWQHNGRTFKGIGFGFGESLPDVKKQAMEFAFSLRQNTYRGESAWQACLSDIRNPSP